MNNSIPVKAVKLPLDWECELKSLHQLLRGLTHATESTPGVKHLEEISYAIESKLGDLLKDLSAADRVEIPPIASPAPSPTTEQDCKMSLGDLQFEVYQLRGLAIGLHELLLTHGNADLGKRGIISLAELLKSALISLDSRLETGLAKREEPSADRVEVSPEKPSSETEQAPQPGLDFLTAHRLAGLATGLHELVMRSLETGLLDDELGVDPLAETLKKELMRLRESAG